MRLLRQESRRSISLIAGCAVLLLASARCRGADPGKLSASPLTLRVGVAHLTNNAAGGLGALVQLLSLEGLARVGDNGRPEPRLAQELVVAKDGLSISVRLRPGVKFHDGSPANAEALVNVLRKRLPDFMGPVFADIDRIAAVRDDQIEISLRKPSPLVQEALDLQIRKPDQATIGTGPFQPEASAEVVGLRANRDYYLGKPTVDRIQVENYPNVRAAWAELLRDRIDLLYEVGVDALDSLQSGKNVTVFTFEQQYQYVIFLNTSATALRSPDVRIALSNAIDRDALIRDALDGHGSPSSGPISPRHWAFQSDFPAAKFDQRKAIDALAGRQIRFTCLVTPEFERLALVLRRQLEALGVDMVLKEVSIDESLKAMATHDFDAALLNSISGPSMFRLYGLWHTHGSFSIGQSTSLKTDAALDQVRYAASDDEYRAGVAAFQRAIVDDPPAIFLAWSERARAMSRRFDVAAEPGRDILNTLRLWRPVGGDKIASRN